MGLTITITGAGGFIGQACVDAARARGHDVRALTRRDCDLSQPSEALINAVTGSDVVIHAAASLSGDAATMRRDTVTATEVVLSALAQAAPRAQLVLLGSIAVHDATARTVSDDTQLDPVPQARDTYAEAKIAQEQALANYPGAAWVLRPGAVFGPGQLWNAHLGQSLGPVFLRLGDATEVPIIDLASCVEAILLAAETPVPGGGHRAVNLVADDLPNARAYLTALGSGAPSLQMPVPHQVLALMGRLLSPLGLRLPGLLQARTISARFAPKTYSNARAKSDLGWAPALWKTALKEVLP